MRISVRDLYPHKATANRFEIVVFPVDDMVPALPFLREGEFLKTADGERYRILASEQVQHQRQDGAGNPIANVYFYCWSYTAEKW